MLHTTQKEIKKYYNGKNDLNKFTRDEFVAIKNDLRLIALSFGIYGMNSGLFENTKTGNYYIIPSRSTRLFELA